MSEKHSTNGNGRSDRAGTYYRMSDDKQENSIERQRSQVEPYALKKGYRIVCEYIDEGIPGDELARRKEFQRMLRDAQRGQFDVIVVDDVDRFGRFDIHRYGAVVDPLRDAGVRLDAVAQGPVDWDDTLASLNDAMRMAFKREQSRDTSRRVLTDFLSRARRAIWLGGPAPYGLRLEPHPTRKKIPVPHEPEAKVVRWLFEQYGNTDTSIDALCEELYRRGVPSPTGKKRWQKTTVQAMLRRRWYIGDYVWNRKPAGKYHRLAGGKAEATNRRTRSRQNKPDEWVVVEDSHEAIVDRDLFMRVQARLAGNRGRTTPQRGRGAFLLTKLMTCSHCGSWMLGFTQGGQRKYRCGGYLHYGKNYCHRNLAHEGDVLEAVVTELQRTFLDPDNLQALRDEVRRQQEEKSRPQAVEALKRQIADLSRRIDRGNENLAILPPDRLAGVVAKVREWEAQRTELAAELDRANRRAAVADLEKRIAQAEKALWTLRESIHKADPPLVRSLLREVVERIDLRFAHRATAKTNRSQLEGGVIHIQDGCDYSFTAARRSGRRT
jgi:DNA invertase Pin-like site-specific DNA recombinase